MSVQKILLSLLILTIIASVSSTTCGTNPLLKSYDVTADFTDSQVVSGINYCKSLKGKDSCCSATTINSFQAKADALLARLRASVIKRDKSLIDIRDTLIPSLKTKLVVVVQAAGVAGRNLSVVDPAKVDATAKALVSYYSQMAYGYIDPVSIEYLKDNFTSYQEARSTCLINIVKTQAAAWCLACSPEYDSKGVSADGIDFSDALVKTLTDSCYDFIDGARILNTYYKFKQISSSLGDIASALNKLADEDLTGTALKKIANTSPDIPSDVFYRPITFPADCTDTKCAWIETDLFKTGKLVENTLVLGGDIPDITKRMLREGLSSRVLASGTWSPDKDEAGVTVTFEDNPGNVGIDDGDDDDDSDDDSGSGNGSFLQKGVTGGLVLLSLVLIFS